MFRTLLLVLIASLVVVRALGFEVDKHPKLKGGFVSSSTAKRYSSDTASVSCHNLEETKKLYDELIKQKVPLAEVTSITQAVENKDLCYVKFKTTFALDVNLENGRDLAASSITNLFNGLLNARLKLITAFNANEFIYDASKKQFLYRAIDNLPWIVTSRNSQSFTSEAKSKLILEKTLEEHLHQNWHRSTSKFDFQFDRYRINENGFSEPNKLQEIKTNEGRNSKGSNDDEDSKILKIEVKKEESQWKVSAELEADRNEFSFDEDKEVFSAYLCQKIDSKVNECINLKENGSQNVFSWTFKVRNNYKIDVDVRLVNSLDRYLNLKLFKVFFVLSDIASARISSTKTFEREFIQKNIKFRSYFMIDRGTDDLLIFETEKKNLDKVKISQKSLVTKFDQQQEIQLFRIPYESFEASLGNLYNFFKDTNNRLTDLQDIFSDKNRQEYSYYQIRIPSDHSLILTNEAEAQAPTIYSHKPKNKFFSSLIHTCDSKHMLLKNRTFEDKHMIFLGEEEKQYNCKVQLFKNESVKTYILNQNTGTFILFRDIYESCIRFDDDVNLSMYIPYRVADLKNFEWNFNIEKTKELPRENICTIFFKDKDNQKFAKFKSKIFEFPKLVAQRVYLSIIFDDKSDNYTFSAYFLTEKYAVKEIVSISNTDPVTFKSLPENLHYNVVGKGAITKNKVTSFFDIQVNYQSSNEIVYAFDVDIKNECQKGINLFFQGNNLVLQCTNTGSATKAGKTVSHFAKKSFSTGLDKIFSQILTSVYELI